MPENFLFAGGIAHCDKGLTVVEPVLCPSFCSAIDVFLDHFPKQSIAPDCIEGPAIVD